MENPSRCAEFDVVQLMQVKIKEVIDSINSYVNNDFCEKGVRVFSANGLRHVEEDVDCFRKELYSLGENILRLSKKFQE